jgi:hypothetical protein
VGQRRVERLPVRYRGEAWYEQWKAKNSCEHAGRTGRLADADKMRINATSSPDANGTIGSEASNAPAGSDGLFGSLLRQALPTVFYMTHDEIVLLLACAVPLWYGVFAALQTLTGAQQPRPRAHALSPAPTWHDPPLCWRSLRGDPSFVSPRRERCDV